MTPAQCQLGRGNVVAMWPRHRNNVMGGVGILLGIKAVVTYVV